MMMAKIELLVFFFSTGDCVGFLREVLFLDKILGYMNNSEFLE